MKMIYVCALVFFVQSCDYYDSRLVIVNRCKCDVSILTFKDTIPDFEFVNHTDFYLSHKIDAESSMSQIEPGKNGWSTLIHLSRNKKLNLFVVRTDSIKKYGSIKLLLEERRYNLYKVTAEELEANNWKVEVD
jgi:hypothetical protein